MAIITPLCQRIFVRYARKPIWMPTAKSKLFRIAEHKFYSPEEMKQIMSLHETYKAQELYIKEFMNREFYIPATQAGGLPAEFVERETERDKQIYEENDQINARIAKLKQQFLSKEVEKFEGRLMEEKLQREEQILNITQRVDDYIKEQKSDRDSFVTPQNIDSMIERAFEKQVSFEYCIDTSGRVKRT